MGGWGVEVALCPSLFSTSTVASSRSSYCLIFGSRRLTGQLASEGITEGGLAEIRLRGQF